MLRLTKKRAAGLIAVGAVAAIGAWFLSAPVKLDAAVVAALPQGDARRGERIFWAGGCASCHAVPKSEGAERLKLPGGVELATPFGTFVTPNISSDANDGIGAWSLGDFANAMQRGVSPGGRHYYPAFPYTSYARMTGADISDLYAFMQTVPAVAGRAPPHKVSFPFNLSRGLGLWKRLYLDSSPVVALDASQEVMLGQYLVEGPGHCGECHTPRYFTGGLKKSQWLAGAVAAEGDGIVPNISGGEGDFADWSAGDIASYLESGFTPDFDTVGGSMVDVQKNMAMLSAEDRAAIAAYLKAVPPHENGYPARKPAGL